MPAQPIYTTPFSLSDARVVDIHKTLDHDAAMLVADLAVEHNRFNGYKDHHLRYSALQMSRCRAEIERHIAVQQQMIVYIEYLQDQLAQ